MSSSNRRYLSIYFKDGLIDKRKKRDVNISFCKDDILYQKFKSLGSSELKKILKIDSYLELVTKARKEDRSVSNYIKSKLRKHIENEGKNTSG